ncbi:hypothetical protein [Spongiactinospora rosea]|uniref:hypothetical protein n=1 Tax=Spongiactinospora rosea TaxID=2248750 RepID=UPI0011C06B45|nr:hypothetical protein [Spongiactinospora rosea]
MNRKIRLRRACTGIAASALLVTGFAALPLTAAQASARCGLSGSYSSGPKAGAYLYSYVIRNCHAFGVQRKIDVARYWDGPCIRVPAGASRRGSLVLPIGTSIRGIKPC